MNIELTEFQKEFIKKSINEHILLLGRVVDMLSKVDPQRPTVTECTNEIKELQDLLKKLS